MKAKRRYPRVGPLIIRASVRREDEIREEYVTSLSEGGAYLVTRLPFQTGESTSLALTLPWGLGDIEVDGKVVYVISDSEGDTDGCPPGVGIAFGDLADEQLEAIRRYVAKFRQLAVRFTEA